MNDGGSLILLRFLHEQDSLVSLQPSLSLFSTKTYHPYYFTRERTTEFLLIPYYFTIHHPLSPFIL